MKIIPKNRAKFIIKPGVTKVWYYLFKEYEIHYNEQFMKSIQTWHRHTKVLETLFILEGQLTALWKAKGRLKRKIVKAGDLIETGTISHTFVNHTKKPVKFIVIKQVLAGKNKRKILRNDKKIDPGT